MILEKEDDSMKIMDVELSDARELLEIYRYYVDNTAVSFELETPSVEQFEQRIIKISAKYPYIKAMDENGRIVGYAYATVFKERAAYDHCVETTVYVDKDCHKRGVGKALYTVLEEKLRNQGILNMNACITALSSESDPYLTDDSPKFHEKMGFSLVGRFHQCGYKFNRWYDMIWMEKMIGEHR